MGKSIILSNRRVEFGFDDATGCLNHVRDLASGCLHLHSPKNARLFRIMCPDGKWRSRYADAQDSAASDIEVEPGLLRIRYEGLAIPDGSMLDATVTVTVTLPEDGLEALFEMEIVNRGPGRLHEVRFPWVGGWSGLDGRDVDRAHAGIVPVKLYPDVPETLTQNLAGSRRRRYVSYGVGMQLPFFDVSGRSGGLSYICYQDKPRLGGMSFENLDREPNGMSASWSWVHFPFVKPGTTWRSPVLGIAVHQGDWRKTADRFRTWADSWWTPAPTPNRLYRTLGLQTVQLRGFDGKPFFRNDEIPRLAREGLAVGLEDLCVWDPITQVYLRPDDGDIWEEFDPERNLKQFRDGVAEARALGVNLSTLMNYRLIRERSSLYGKIGERLALRTLDGAPVWEDVSRVSYAHAEYLTDYLSQDGRVLCQKPDEFRKRSMEITRRTKEFGFDSHFFDQPFEFHPCLSEDHGHGSPDEVHETALEWIRDACRIFRDENPEGYVIGELSEAYALSVFDVSWIWEISVLAPEVMRYTFPEALHYMVVDRQPEILNRAFALGMLAAFTTRELEGSLQDYPEFGRRIAQVAALRKATAEVTTLARFRYKDGLIVTDGIDAYVFESAESVAVTIADESNVARKVSLRIDSSRYPQVRHAAPERMELHRQDGSVAAAGWTDESGVQRCEFDLAALEVAVWTITMKGRTDAGRDAE